VEFIRRIKKRSTIQGTVKFLSFPLLCIASFFSSTLFAQNSFPENVNYELTFETNREGAFEIIHVYIQNFGDPTLLVAGDFKFKLEDYQTELGMPLNLNVVEIVDSLTGPWDNKSNPDFDNLTGGGNPFSGILSITINPNQTLSPIYRFEDVAGETFPDGGGSLGYPIPYEKTRIGALKIPATQSAGELNFTWLNTTIIAGPLYYHIDEFANKLDYTTELPLVDLVSDRGDSPVCHGTPGVFFSNISAGNIWTRGFDENGDTIVVDPGQTSIIVDDLKIGENVYLSNINGFRDNGEFDVDQANPVTLNFFRINLGPDKVIIPGGQVVITASFSAPDYPGVTYKWSPAEGLDNTSSPSVIASPKSSQTYILEITPGNAGCVVLDTIKVIIEQFVAIRPVIFLQGPIGNGGMNALRVQELENKFGVSGTGNLKMISGFVPENAVELVKVGLIKRGTDQAFSAGYCWLLSDGSVLDFETAQSDFVKIFDPSIFQGNQYHVEVSTANHLGAISKRRPSLTTLPSTINFTYAQNILGGRIGVEEFNGRAYLPAGDLNQDGKIDNADQTLITNDNNQSSSGIYLNDLNLDGVVNQLDINLMNKNAIENYVKTRP
jgi:hypothetical protein